MKKSRSDREREPRSERISRRGKEREKSARDVGEATVHPTRTSDACRSSPAASREKGCYFWRLRFLLSLLPRGRAAAARARVFASSPRVPAPFCIPFLFNEPRLSVSPRCPFRFRTISRCTFPFNPLTEIAGLAPLSRGIIIIPCRRDVAPIDQRRFSNRHGPNGNSSRRWNKFDSNAQTKSRDCFRNNSEQPKNIPRAPFPSRQLSPVVSIRYLLRLEERFARLRGERIARRPQRSSTSEDGGTERRGGANKEEERMDRARE